jgi:hypothetical protein
MKENDSLFEKIFAYVCIILFCTIIGGGIGYISQTGLLDIFYAETSKMSAVRDVYFDKAFEPISVDEYKFRTRLGWWVGCIAGALLGVYMVRNIRNKMTRQPNLRGDAESRMPQD